MTRVLVIGGGVAGLTAAHELATRGFEVDVVEPRTVVGGKARTIAVPGTGTSGRRGLPGEHGFRFFPGFYRHIDDTMARIPFGVQRRGVLDNLVDTTRMAVVHPDRPTFVNIARFPRSLDDVLTAVRALVRADFDARPGELMRLVELLWCVATTCDERREQELDRMPVTVAARANEASLGYQELVGLTQIFVALRSDHISAKTAGGVGLQMLLDLMRPGSCGDRVLTGPTSDAWLEPWREHLLRLGVRFHMGSAVRRLHVSAGRIVGVDVLHAGHSRRMARDWYVLAVPVEVAASLLDAPLLAADPSLARLRTLAEHTRWMVGMQLFLRGEHRWVHGHTIHMRSPWALTSVFHEPFWRPEVLATFGDGTAGSVLSVDISDWDTPGYNGRAARDCTPEQIKHEVWAQLVDGLRVDGRPLIDEDDVLAWQLDPGFHCAGPGRAASHDEPLFANLAGGWSLRPDATTAIANLFLAGDYVRTTTDLASMEGANEAARRAVNGILARSGAIARPCALYRRREPALLAPLRWWDRQAHRRGWPWLFGRWPEPEIHARSTDVAPETGSAVRALNRA